jgi:hypothetical protein
MMKKRFIVFLILGTFVFTSQVSAQTDFNDFWKKFKTAVSQNDKTALADLTKYPLEMPYGVASIKNKTQFSRSFGKIFNGETNAAKCFAKAKPVKENAKTYTVSCGFKGDENNADNAPILYKFELTKTGWRFAGLDNINE